MTKNNRKAEGGHSKSLNENGNKTQRIKQNVWRKGAEAAAAAAPFSSTKLLQKKATCLHDKPNHETLFTIPTISKSTMFFFGKLYLLWI